MQIVLDLLPRYLSSQNSESLFVVEVLIQKWKTFCYSSDDVISSWHRALRKALKLKPNKVIRFMYRLSPEASGGGQGTSSSVTY